MSEKEKADELYKKFLPNNPTKNLSAEEMEQIILINTKFLCDEMVKESYKIDMNYYRDFRKFWMGVYEEMVNLCSNGKKRKKK